MIFLFSAMGLYYSVGHARQFSRKAKWKRLRAASSSLDLRELNIAQLQAKDYVMMLKRGKKGAVLTLPPEAVATNILRHDSEILVKVVAPVRSNAPWDGGKIQRFRVCLLGKDVTNQPFMLELPPQYADKTIEECEGWVTQTTPEDKLIEA